MDTTWLAEGPRASNVLVPVPYRVAAGYDELADTRTLELEPAGEGRLEPFMPGQFAMLGAFGGGEVPISVSGAGDDGRLLHTVRSVGPSTRALGSLRPGDVLGARGPFGTGWPLEEVTGADVVIVAGGIGLAPLRPAIRHVLARRERYGSVAVLYGSRSPGELLYADELAGWRGRGDVEVSVTVDAAPGGWRGRVGVVTQLIRSAGFDPASAVALVCGPEVMMRFAASALDERGVAAEDIVVSLERNMRCGVGFCGHCQVGPLFVCTDGPVCRWAVAEPLLRVPEL